MKCTNNATTHTSLHLVRLQVLAGNLLDAGSGELLLELHQLLLQLGLAALAQLVGLDLGL